MDFRSLRYFIEIVRCGNYSLAAKRIPLSQPALSKAIKTLEEELGVVLLERGKRGVQVRTTPAGAVVLRHAHTLLEQQGHLQAELVALEGLNMGELRIGIPPLGGSEIFAPLISQFRQRYPAVKIVLLEGGSERLEDAVRKGEVELAATLIPHRNDLASHFITDEQLVVAVPINHPLASLPQLTLHELVNIPLIMYNDSFVLTRLIREAFARARLKPEEVTQIAWPEFGVALVASGAGAMLFPRIVARRHAHTEGITMIPLQSEELRWKMALAWRKEAELSSSARALLQLMQETRQD